MWRRIHTVPLVLVITTAVILVYMETSKLVVKVKIKPRMAGGGNTQMFSASETIKSAAKSPDPLGQGQSEEMVLPEVADVDINVDSGGEVDIDEAKMVDNEEDEVAEEEAEIIDIEEVNKEDEDESFDDPEKVDPPMGLTNSGLPNWAALGGQSSNGMCPMDLRIAHARDACKKRGILQWDKIDTIPVRSLPHLLVDDMHQVMYCGFAKAASTMWIAYLARSTGKVKSNERVVTHNAKKIAKFGLRYLQTYTPQEIRYRLKNYFKFIVVRHPLIRLESAWRDKLVMSNSPYRNSWGKRIIIKHRGNYTKGELTKFHEFAQDVGEGFRNEHWSTYKKCAPCMVPYDYISRTETVEEDSPYIYEKKLNSTMKPYIVHSHATEVIHNTTLMIPQFKQVSQDTYDKLMRIYGQDMDVFGYDFDYKSATASCRITGKDGKSCC